MSYRINEREEGKKIYTEYVSDTSNVVKIGVNDNTAFLSLNDVDQITIDGTSSIISNLTIEDLSTSGDLTVGGDFELQGNFSMTDTQWDDLRAPATAINPPGQVSDPAWDNTNGGYLYDPDGTNVLWIILQMPHGWKEESTIIPHIHWFPTSTHTGNVYWRLEYKWTNVNDTDAGAFTTVNILDAGDGTTLKHQIASFGEIAGTGKKLSAMFVAKISRIGGDGTDSYTGNALFREFDIHYQIDAIGSDGQYTK